MRAISSSRRTGLAWHGRPAHGLDVAWASRPCHAKSPDARGFSLIEVVAAVAIFAIGMVSVLGVFAPVTRSVANVGEAESAARVADAVRARLNAMPFDAALVLIQDPAVVRTKDADGGYNPNDGTKHPAVMFGKLNGEIGIFEGAEGRARWIDSRDAVFPDRDKFFEIDLIRNPTLSPAAGDALAPMVAFTMRVRWPAFQPAPGGGFVQVGSNPGAAVRFDHGKKQVLFYTGAIRR